MEDRLLDALGPQQWWAGEEPKSKTGGYGSGQGSKVRFRLVSLAMFIEYMGFGVCTICAKYIYLHFDIQKHNLYKVEQQ